MLRSTRGTVWLFVLLWLGGCSATSTQPIEPISELGGNGFTGSAGGSGVPGSTNTEGGGGTGGTPITQGGGSSEGAAAGIGGTNGGSCGSVAAGGAPPRTVALNAALKTCATTDESGAEVRIAVHLSARPTNSVTVRAVSSDLTEGEVITSPRTFTTANWNDSQTFVVKGQSDALADGVQNYQVDFELTSEDADYAGLKPNAIQLRNEHRAAFHGLDHAAHEATSTRITDLSGDGLVVVGFGTSVAAGSVTQAFRSSVVGGFQWLSPLSPCGAWGTNHDGSIIVGDCNNLPDYTGSGAVVWNASTVAEALMPPPASGSSGVWYRIAKATSDDGAWIVGSASQGAPETLGFLWDRTHPENWITAVSAREPVNDISADGAVTVGHGMGSRHMPLNYAVRNNTKIPYPFADTDCITPGTCGAEALSVSSDGSYIVGWASIQSMARLAFEWSEAAGTQKLATLEGTTGASTATAVSDGGGMIVGFSTTSAGKEAVLWRRGEAPVTVKCVLLSAGIDLSGWVLSDAVAVSRDGQTIAGNGIDPAGNGAGWRAVLP